MLLACAEPPEQAALRLTAPMGAPYLPALALALPKGAVAQLVERLVRNEEVSGSIPLGSTSFGGRP